FGHIADEGFFDACAGDLLRRRSALNANHILVFTDIKKKHASHAITADIDLQYTADAARFFLTDGIVITGTVTGRPVDVESLKNLEAPSVLKIVGSGVTPENINMVFPFADAFIVGSTLKKNGVWHNPPHKQRVDRMMKVFKRLAGADSRRE
ncbi:BtpA family membrane complex biogenesis protein, partial [bacterium]|nr:BtpA family membrane complex biogenesis protein [candidate division CSSED10-310 bacterium]